MRYPLRYTRRYTLLLCALVSWLAVPGYEVSAAERVTTRDIIVQATRAEEEAKFESQQKTIITKAEIEKKQDKSVEDIVFNETGVTRTVDSMGRVGVSIRGAEPRHTLILVDGKPVMGDLAKYSGAGDELQRLGTETWTISKSFKVQPVPSMGLMLSAVSLMSLRINRVKSRGFVLIWKEGEKKETVIFHRIPTIFYGPIRDRWVSSDLTYTAVNRTLCPSMPAVPERTAFWHLMKTTVF